MVRRVTAFELESVVIGDTQTGSLGGPPLLARLLDTAAEYVLRLRRHITAGELPERIALFGRIRGTGPGVSFTELYQRLREAYPAPLRSPFEESETVSGAVLEASKLISAEHDDALLVLRFEAASRDLPMHAHENSERFIYVAGGRGYFHVSTESVEGFTGRGIRHVPVRASDLIMFRRGTVHTFSTDIEPLELLSCHAPYVPLEDERQYVLPAKRVCPALTADPRQSQIACDTAWTCMS